MDCEQCGSTCSTPTILQCKHLLCSSCDSSLEFKTVDLERGKECPLCRSFSPKNFISQELRHFDLPTVVPNSKVWPNSLVTVSKLQLKEAKRVVLEFVVSGHAIYSVQGEIWVACKDQPIFLVYSEAGFFVRKQVFDREAITHPNTVAALGPKEIAVSCLNSGLWILRNKQSGRQSLKHIAPGNFIDFCVYNNCIYCLEDKTAEIHVFSMCNDTWEKSEQEITLQDYDKISNMDSICVYQDHIYLGSWMDNCIYRYTMNGNKDNKFGEPGPPKVRGKLRRPRIISKDQMGSLLICDAFHQQLQVHGKICDVQF